MAVGRPTDGKAELRMNTFDALGFELNTVSVRSRSLDKGRWVRSGGQGVVGKEGAADFSSAVRLCHLREL
jgi:hypothetical protein